MRISWSTLLHCWGTMLHCCTTMTDFGREMARFLGEKSYSCTKKTNFCTETSHYCTKTTDFCTETRHFLGKTSHTCTEICHFLPEKGICWATNPICCGKNRVYWGRKRHLFPTKKLSSKDFNQLKAEKVLSPKHQIPNSLG